VRYLVENSLGRLWLLNRPGSKLAEQMDYYIADRSTVASEPSGTDHRSPFTDYLRVNSPEELRIGDPAVGSGHMLTYAFDLLYLIYEEQGYNPREIPRLILEHNLTGMEIDERAAALAAFALAMKARAKDSRFLRRGVRPNICVLHSVQFTEPELAGTAWLAQAGRQPARPARARRAAA
jgi:type II restriction/modification system DNA methylase subunit YeeA